ncbi:MAG: hypothetical protein N2D54_11410, partial [Chloroflexota bacterium]
MKTKLILISFLSIILIGCESLLPSAPLQNPPPANGADVGDNWQAYSDENAEPNQDAIIPVEVTYFTPAQQEGPYYPVEKLTDRDNDLTVLAGASGEPEGRRIIIFGVVYNAKGFPIPGAMIEIW